MSHLECLLECGLAQSLLLHWPQGIHCVRMSGFLLKEFLALIFEVVKTCGRMYFDFAYHVML